MEYVKLSDIFEKPINGEWGTELQEGESEYKVIRTTNFTNQGVLNLKDIVSRNIDIEKYESKLLRYGDIIIEKSGGSPNQPVGRVVIFEVEDQEYFCNNFTSILRPKAKLFPRYGLYLMRSLYNKRKVLKYQNKTTGIINLKLADYLNHTLVPLPLLETQIKIANMLDQAQLLIDKRKEQIKALDDLIQSVFYEMFINNKEEWRRGEVEKVCTSILGGGTPSTKRKEYFDGDIPWVTPKDMKKLKISTSQIKINQLAIDNSSAKIIPSKSVLMVIRSGILKKTLPVAINECEVAINQDMKAFVVNKDIMNEYYLLYYFKSIEPLLLSRVRAVTADNIEFNVIKKHELVIPPLNLQNEFAKKVEAIEAQKSLLNQSLVELEMQFEALMQRAFKGELI